ncbi:DUF397 domain-containing protein, partial [Streptomyces sp. NPDC005388]
RNSGRPASPSLIFTPAEWGAFVSGAREGEFDQGRGRPDPRPWRSSRGA